MPQLAAGWEDLSLNCDEPAPDANRHWAESVGIAEESSYSLLGVRVLKVPNGWKRTLGEKSLAH